MSERIDYDFGEEGKGFLKGIEEVVPYLFATQLRTGNCDRVLWAMLSDSTTVGRARERRGDDIDVEPGLLQGDSVASLRDLGLHMVQRP